ncbi:hypothetical protein [Methylobacterium nigriterrae]|uniref:hypothetical protein n=1 Tax=Methylobacterium nigriterrae TaxID=3127512 RepID=UPI00301348FC
MSHKFKVGQHVRQFRNGYADAQSGFGAIFEVVRLMPEDATGEPFYRIRSASGGERAVREGEITLAS